MEHAIAVTVIALGMLATGGRAETPGPLPVESYPGMISKGCRGGIAKLYDQCSDQNRILDSALKSAQESGKRVLLVYGAEWCIWCHVFDKYVAGQSRAFIYEFEYEGEQQTYRFREREPPDAEADARDLNRYVAENFVVAYIEADLAPNGPEVLARTGVDPETVEFYPFILVTDSAVRFLGSMPRQDEIPGLEIRADNGAAFRGFGRGILLRELTRLRELPEAPRVE